MKCLETKLNRQMKTMLLLLVLSTVLLMYYQFSVNSFFNELRLPRHYSVHEDTCVMSMLHRREPNNTDLHFPEKIQGSRWIVTHEIGAEGKVELSGWIVLIHGEPTANNPNCKHPKCCYLDDELQKGFRLEFYQNLPREMIAYMFAMAKGASYIFVVHYWNISLNGLLETFRYEEFATGIVAKTTKTIIDATTIFNEGKSSKINASLTLSPHYIYYDYYIRENIHPLIQTCVPWNTKSHFKRGIDQPQVFIPSGTFISFDFEQTLFHRNAFWALGLKDLPSGSIFAQTFLWEIEGSLGTSPKRKSEPIPGKRHPDYLFENPHFMDVMKNFDCRNTFNFLECFSCLKELLTEERLISNEVQNVLDSWNGVLKNIGYKSPRRSRKREKEFDPKLQTTGIFSPSRTVPKNNVALRHLRRVCPNSDLPKTTEIINDIALIISFNVASSYSTIPFLEAMYRHYFRHIIFCGPKIEKFRSFAFNSTIGSFIFIEGFKNAKFECIMAAMKMDLNVKGIVQIRDDTLLIPWVVKKLPKEKIWLVAAAKNDKTSSDKLKPKWVKWKEGKNNINEVLEEIEAMKESHLKSDFETRFIENFRNNSRHFTRYYMQGCDFMYVPLRIKDDFIRAGNLFIKHRVMLEIGFPNIALGIDKIKNIHFVQKGTFLKHLQNKKIYRLNTTFIHPFEKLKKENTEMCDFFCDYIKM